MKYILTLLALFPFMLNAQRTERYLEHGWKFSHTDRTENAAERCNDSKWQTVSVPHDWAIAGPFDKDIDKQTVAITQNGETEATEKTGRSGSLPWIGVGWYRTQFTVEKGCQRALLNFDGAMSEPQVYVNGQLAGEWKYGYSAFIVDITPYIHTDGKANTLAVRLQNVEESSRWYPGAGLYRPVKLITTNEQAISEWSINAVTETIADSQTSADVRFSVSCTKPSQATTVTFTTNGETCTVPFTGNNATHLFTLNRITPWTPETPKLYELTVQLMEGDRVVDEKTVKYGIRTVQVSEQNGFCLNGKTRKIKGVCLHHDLGMFGAAVHRSALLRQLRLLKEMGCDAIRTSHNMPSQWQMELCDSLGMMVMAESFDMWRYPKCKNGYARFYDQWWERDLTNLVEANRLHPSIVMWSIGNEIPEQGNTEGNAMTRRMQNLVHHLDPTRPVTAGMDRIDNAIATGYAQVLDIPGVNYRLPRYEAAYQRLRHGFLLGSETASTISSRGVYKFPVVPRKSHAYDDGQCSGYDVESCSWSNLPDEDWAWQDDNPWVIGEFVWTGFDYLGEPTPYDTYWPSRSSYFGIFDLAGLPKDRYWLYRSHWNPKAETIHLLPHWTWNGREGQTTPVYCYTNYPTAELFVNGVSQGRISKDNSIPYTAITAENDTLLNRYRLRWDNVVYQPGEVAVVVYDENGQERGRRTLHTADAPAAVTLALNDELTDVVNGEFSIMPLSLMPVDAGDMLFLTARIVDNDGYACPQADNLLRVSVCGGARFKGMCNGDPTSLDPFTEPSMHAFNGALVLAVEVTDPTKPATITVSSKGLRTAQYQLPTGQFVR